MKKIAFFDWTIQLQADLTAITDHHEKKMVILEPSIELNGVIWKMKTTSYKSNLLGIVSLQSIQPTKL
ncbi:hypothetical protein ACQ4LK_08220 [Bacillus pumilus]|uniref:hypothetical protein n=1 Tax=Bacillus pumilus TaxID=1408 RepID=UPI003CFBB3AB